MKVSINQPAYLPWLGYYDRIDFADLHIVLDHVQFEKNSFTNRNKIPTKDGSMWLTVPLKTKGKFGDLAINRIEIADNVKWKKKHLSSIQRIYRKTLFFDRYFPELETIYRLDWKYLNDIITKLDGLFLSWLNITTKILHSGELDIKSTKSDLVLDLCEYANARTYVSGTLGKNYLNIGIFQDKNIKVIFQEYAHPVYDHSLADFEPNMCILDLLFHYGDESLDIIKKGRNFI